MISYAKFMRYLQTLTEEEIRMVRVRDSEARFGFAGGASQSAMCRVTIPVPCLASTTEVDVIEGGDCPFLVSLAQLKRMKAKLDCENMTMESQIGGNWFRTKLRATESGHMAMSLTREVTGAVMDQNSLGDVYRTIDEEMIRRTGTKPEEAKKTYITTSSSFQ